MIYTKASALPYNPRPQMAEIFAEGFYDDGLKYFSKDKIKLAKAFEHIFMLENFYVTEANGEILAIVGCVDKKPPPVKLDKKILVQQLGFFRGRLAFWGVSKFILNKPYPFDQPITAASIEFVATAPAHRGKGAAFGLIGHVMNDMSFDQYVLEVVSHNAAAMRLYEKLGFVEFMRVPEPKRSGIEFFVYMRRG